MAGLVHFFLNNIFSLNKIKFSNQDNILNYRKEEVEEF